MGSSPTLRNQLQQSKSTYLLQHAQQKIAWQEWNPSILELAETHQKLVVISIGYASCHWCHVMAKEAFSDPEVSNFMNRHFINIKVDREERPDVDQTYMLALQLLTQQGGWPLNIVALPNGQPLWGCTYLSAQDWLRSLQKIIQIQTEKPQSLVAYGKQMVEILNAYNREKSQVSQDQSMTKTWENLWEKTDPIEGGFSGGPKFPMPCQIDLWHTIGLYFNAPQWTQHWQRTLDRMARGGIFDQLGGGFARYCVNQTWNIPHFEKMAYDNGQLLNSFAQGYKATKSPLYKEIVDKTVNFIAQHWTTSEGGFWAAWDADSWDANTHQQREGAYYTWTLEELEGLPLNAWETFKSYYGIAHELAWEGVYILHRPLSDVQFCKQHSLSEKTLESYKSSWETTLLNQRNLRKQPPLDQLIICSWNAILSKGLLAVAFVFEKDTAADLALKNVGFLLGSLKNNSNQLYRNYSSKGPYNPAFLEDYAGLISLCVEAYQYTWDERYLLEAFELQKQVLDLFWDSDQMQFTFSSRTNKEVFFEAHQNQDDVIPSPYAITCENLFLLGYYFEQWDWIEQAQKLLDQQLPFALEHPRAYGYWLKLAVELPKSQQVYIGGTAANSVLKQLKQSTPGRVLWGLIHPKTKIPALQNKGVTKNLQIYICKDQSCLAALSTIEDAVQILKQS